MIRIAHVDKRYHKTRALTNVSFCVARGEVVGLLGPNGAGKSTTLRIVSGYLEPDAGQVVVAGHDVVTARAEALRHIGYLPEAVPTYPGMSVGGYLRFRARTKGVARRDVEQCVHAALTHVSLQDRAHLTIARLSRGLRQRVGIADALVARPPVLLFDEPTSGLDPLQVRQFRDTVEHLKREHAIVLSSHALREVEAVATRLVVLDQGKVVFDGCAQALLEQTAGHGGLEHAFVELLGGPAGAVRDTV